MNTINKNYLIDQVFTEDMDKKVLVGLFTDHKEIKEVNISVNFKDPFMLLAYNKVKNVTVEVNSIQDKRLIIKKGGRCGIVIMNILLDLINECLVKDYGNGKFEFKFEVCNLSYSLHIQI